MVVTVSPELATLPEALGEVRPEAQVMGKPQKNEITQGEREGTRRTVTHGKRMFTPWGEHLRKE